MRKTHRIFSHFSISFLLFFLTASQLAYGGDIVGKLVVGYQGWFACKDACAPMIYVAMFDEVNEGTAIFKCTDKPPVSNIAKFVGMDGMPSDHYLWLTGLASEYLKSGKVLPKELPVRINK